MSHLDQDASGEGNARFLMVIMALVAATMVFTRGNVLLADPDTQWHIAVGRLMWETGQMPRVDTFSHTYAGQPWIAKEWLSQLLLFAAFSLAGWTGVVLLGSLCIALTAAVTARYLLREMPPLMAIFICWIAINSLLGIATPRPHVLALPVAAVFIVMLLRATERDQSPPWLALPVMVLWANLHAAFTLGFVIAAFIGLDALLRAAPERRLRLTLQWAAFGLGLLVAACLHPYGPQSILINIDMAKGNESVPLIGEWDPHPILGPTGFRVLVPALLIGTLLLGGWRNAARIGLGAFLLYLTMKHQRFIMILAITAPLLTRTSARAGLMRLSEGLNLFRWPDPLRNRRWRMPMAISVMALALAAPFIGEQPALPASSAPQEALNSVTSELRARPVYNGYNFGGFLVLQRVPTFIDGRTDQLFTDNFMARYHRYMEARDAASFLAFIEGRGVRWALTQPGYKDTEILEKAPGWRRTYSDDTAMVFVRDGG
jgi:hypothetical protein